MGEIVTNYIRRRRNRSSAGSDEKIATSPAAKKLKDAKAHDNADNEDDSQDELMETLDTIGSISEQLKSILRRLKKLDIIENSVKNIEANLANLKARSAKLEQFEITAAKDIKDLKESTTLNGNTCKELQDRIDKHSSRINSLMASERKLRDQMNEVVSKNLIKKHIQGARTLNCFPSPKKGTTPRKN